MGIGSTLRAARIGQLLRLTGRESRRHQLIADAARVAVEPLEQRTMLSATLTWSPTGGSSSWNTTTANWLTSTNTRTIWSNSAGDSAVFPGSGGTVTLAGNISVASVEFAANGYTMNGYQLTFSGSSQQITVDSGTAAVNSYIAGTSLVKLGGGTLIASNFSTSGSLNLNIASGAISDAGNGSAGLNTPNLVISPGAELDLTGGVSYVTASFTNAGTLNLNGGSIVIDASSFDNESCVSVTNGGLTYNTQASFDGTLDINAGGTFTGSVDFNQASVAIGDGGQLISDYVFTEGSSWINVGAGGALIAGASLSLDGQLGIASGGLVDIGGFYGYGSIDNYGTFNISGSCTIDGSLQNEAGAFVRFSDSQISLDSYSSVTNYGEIHFQSSDLTGSVTDGDGGTMQFVSSALNIAEGQMLKVEGSLSLDGSSQLSIDNGYLNIESGAIDDQGALSLSNSNGLIDSGYLTLDSGASFTIDNGSSFAVTDCSTLTINSGATLDNQGSLVVSSSTMAISGGTLTVETAAQLDISSNSSVSTNGGTCQLDGSLAVDGSTIDPQVTGSSSMVGGLPYYSLNLARTYTEGDSGVPVTITAWGVNWGDTSPPDAYTVTDTTGTIIDGHWYSNDGTTPTITVTAITSAYGSIMPLTLTLPATFANGAPPAPVNLSASESTADEVDLNWSYDTNLASSFTLAVFDANNNLVSSQTVDSGALTCSVSGLTADENYTFSLTANVPQPNGSVLESSAAVLTAAASAAPIFATGPGAINEGSTGGTLQLSSGSPAHISSWTTNWTDQDGVPITSVTVTGANGSHAYPAPSIGTQMMVATITAQDIGGFTFTLPEYDVAVVSNSPSGLSATTISASQINLSWTDHSANAIGDVIYQSDDGGTTFYPIDEITSSAAGGSNTYHVTGLNPGTPYQFYVTADSGGAESNASNTATAATTFIAPTLDVEGTGTVVEGQSYELNLVAQYPDGEPGSIDHWLVDYHDGTGGASDVISYSYPSGSDPTQPLTVTHVFNAHIASPTVTIVAVDVANGSFTADSQSVVVTPKDFASAPSVNASGSSINVGWTNVSNISTGTTVLLSTDDTAFFEVASAVAGSSTTISNLDLDTQYWVKVLSEGANGESNESSAVSVSTPYTAPTLVILPTSVPTEGQSYGLNLSAIYADGTPQKDLISSWQIDLGDGQSTKTYNLDTPGDSTIVSGNAYAMNATSATVKITAVDGTGRTILQPDQTLLLSPPTATQPGGSSIDATTNEINWYGGGNALPASTNYIVQKLSPGSSTWTDIGTVAAHDFTSTDYGPSYSFTDDSVSTTAIGTDVGQMYRVCAVTSGAADHNAGTPGVSVTDAFHIATAADSSYYSQTVYQPDDTSDPMVYSGLDGVTGSWSPDIGEPNSPTYFSSGDTITFTVSNLIPHVALDLDIYGGSTGSPTSGDLVTLTGPDSREVTTTTVNDRFIVAAVSTSTSSATFTLKLDIPGNDSDGHARKWNIDGVYLKCQDGFQVMNDASVDVGGVTNVPITVTANDSDQPLAGDVFTLVNYDHSKIQPVGDGTVTLDANGQGVLPIEGLAVGTTPIVLEDAIGDQATANVASLAPQVTSTGSEVEGGTYNTGPGDKAGFTFSIPQASQTDVTINFNTSGSTLPDSVLAQLGNSVTIPAGQTSVFKAFSMADDGKIAPDRFAVVNLVVAGAAQPQQATLKVINNGLPKISINGEQFGASVPLDIQGDPKLFASVVFSVPHDETLDSLTFTWDPTQDIIWTTKKLGKVGVDDLGSLSGVAKDTSGYHYTWTSAAGKIPTELWAQAIANSTTQGFDPPVTGTNMGVGVEVSKPATKAVPAASRTTSSGAHAIQLGPTLSLASFVNLNGNDDNGSNVDNGIPVTRDFEAGQEPVNDPDLIQATVSVPSFLNTGNIALIVNDSVGGKVKLWLTANKSSAVTSFTITPSKSSFIFYVEGVFPSSELNDITITATLEAIGISVVTSQQMTVTPILTDLKVTAAPGAVPTLVADPPNQDGTSTFSIASGITAPGTLPVNLEADAIEGDHPNGELRFFANVKNLNMLPGGVGASFSAPGKPNFATRKWDFGSAAGVPYAGRTLVDGTPFFTSHETVGPNSTTAEDNPRLEVGPKPRGGVIADTVTTAIDVVFSFVVYAVWDYGGSPDTFAVLGETDYSVEFNGTITKAPGAVPVWTALGSNAINPSLWMLLLDPSTIPTAYKPPSANGADAGWR